MNKTMSIEYAVTRLNELRKTQKLNAKLRKLGLADKAPKKKAKKK